MPSRLRIERMLFMQHIIAPLVGSVNSAACCARTSAAHNSVMATSKQSKIEPIHVEEARKLKALFNERAGMSQEAFGDKYGLGSQGMVWQYLNARSPLNLEAAIKFARALQCFVREFSPRLAEALDGSVSNPMTPAEIAAAFEAGSPGKQEALTLLARLPEAEAEAILPLIRSILAKYE